jgi:integrase
VKRTEQKWSFGEHPLYEDRVLMADWASFHFEQIDDQRARAAFRLSCKDFASIYLTDIVGLGVNPSPGTLGNRIRLFRRLVRWMIANQIYRFKDVTSTRIVMFIEEQLSEKTLTKKHILKYLHVLEKLWAYRGQYANSLAVDPSTVPKLGDLISRGKDILQWEAVPLAHAVSLIKDSVFCLENFGDVVVHLLREIERYRGSFVGLNHSQMRARTRAAHEVVSQVTQYLPLVQYLGLPMNSPIRNVLREAIHHMLGAALTVLLFFTGMRCSEVLLLKVGSYSQRDHQSGGRYWYIDGIQAKSGGLERAWVVPIPVVRTLSFLEDLHSALMGSIENDYLFAIPDGNGILPPPFVKIRRLWPSTASNLIKRFATSRGRTGQALPTIHPHQARKTFARFVVLRDKSALESLAQYYGHLYTALLDGAYVGIDVELHQLLSEEAEGQIEAGLTELISTQKLGGKAGIAFGKIRDEMMERFRGRPTISTIAKELIKEGVVLSPCDWGYCIYVMDLSSCGGNDRGPNLRVREPNMCGSCSNLAVTERHRQWWEGRLKREEEFLADPNLSEQAREIAAKRLEVSWQVLMSLNQVEQDE